MGIRLVVRPYTSVLFEGSAQVIFLLNFSGEEFR
jgi:hypothetical protein